MSMNEKTDVQVIINDKRYTISGYESSDYLQHIANYINEKLQSFKKQDRMIILKHRSWQRKTNSSRAK